MRQAMQRPHGLAFRQQGIFFARLCQQAVAILQRHDGVHLGIDEIDMVEVGVHHLDAGEFARGDGRRQSARIHHHDVGNCRQGRCGRQHRRGARAQNRAPIDAEPFIHDPPIAQLMYLFMCPFM